MLRRSNFATFVAKLRKNECNAKEKLVFLCISECSSELGDFFACRLLKKHNSRVEKLTNSVGIFLHSRRVKDICFRRGK